MDYQVQILNKVSIKGIDITMSRVQFGKRVRYQTNWFESGKDLNAVLKENGEMRLAEAKEHFSANGWEYSFNPEKYERFDFYYPGATSELKAKKHFKLLAETARTMQFETT